MDNMQIVVQHDSAGSLVFAWSSLEHGTHSSEVLHAPFSYVPAEIWLECGHASRVVGSIGHTGGHAGFSCFSGFEEQYAEPLRNALWIEAKYFNLGDMLSVAPHYQGVRATTRERQMCHREPTQYEFWREMTEPGYSYVQDMTSA